MIGNLLMRGMLVGLIAGLLAFGFAKVVGEPHINRAIQLEGQVHSHEHEGHQHGAAPAEPEEPELFSRDVQSGIGLFTGVAAYGAGVGGLFALVYAYAYGRLGRFSPRALAALLAAGGFVSTILVPMLKYPANPPAVGNPESIGERTALYFAMLVISLAALALAVKVGRRLAAKLGNWNASLAAAAAFIVTVAVAQFLLPAVNEVPEGFPADLLWNFRIASLGIQLVLWSMLGLLFGELTERSTRGRAGFAKSALR